MPAYTKIKCELCGAEISKSNMSKHLRRHQMHPETFLTDLKLNCRFCKKPLTSRISLTHHEKFCKQNPDYMRSHIKGFNNPGRTAWNKGLTKETDERVKQRSDKLAARYASGELKGSFTGKRHSQDTKAKLRDVALQRGLGGHPYRNNISYKGIQLDSSLEQLFAEKLDEQGIQWKRCSRFQYTDPQGKMHSYTPDFYLPKYDVYFDPKNDYLINNVNPALGFKDSDKIRWVSEQNNIRVFILSKQDILKFNIEEYMPR